MGVHRIAEAHAKHGGERTRFAVGAAEDLDAPEQFDAIVCNSGAAVRPRAFSYGEGA